MANQPVPAQNLPAVTLVNGVPVTTSLVIAEGGDVTHRAVLQLLRRHLGDLEEFGRVAFETRPFETAGGTQQQEIALLNEQQTTLLFTYMKNTAPVRGVKKRLVREFYEMHYRPAPRPALEKTRPESLPAPARSYVLLTLENGAVVESRPLGVDSDLVVVPAAVLRALVSQVAVAQLWAESAGAAIGDVEAATGRQWYGRSA